MLDVSKIEINFQIITDLYIRLSKLFVTFLKMTKAETKCNIETFTPIIGKLLEYFDCKNFNIAFANILKMRTKTRSIKLEFKLVFDKNNK